MKKRINSKEFKEFKDSMQRDLNSYEYPFVVTIQKNKNVARWKTQQIQEEADNRATSSFSVTYILSRDKTFCGGETLLIKDTYKPPMSTEARTVFYSLYRRICPGEKELIIIGTLMSLIGFVVLVWTYRNINYHQCPVYGGILAQLAQNVSR